MYYKVTDHPQLLKDSHSKAVLNTDVSAVKRHQERFAKINKEQERDTQIAQLKEEVASIKDSVSQILTILKHTRID
jgi:hypothetical protein